MAQTKTLTRNGKTYAPYFERRRYGTTTYTWLTGFRCSDGSLIDYNGDPWPCVVPPTRDIEAVLDYKLETLKNNYT